MTIRRERNRGNRGRGNESKCSDWPRGYDIRGAILDEVLQHGYASVSDSRVRFEVDYRGRGA